MQILKVLGTDEFLLFGGEALPLPFDGVVGVLQELFDQEHFRVSLCLLVRSFAAIGPNQCSN